MYSFNCLIKTDASLVKGSLSESHGETELLANLYGKIICIEDDANGMSPTETVPTPVDVFDIILGYREASELISFAEDMKKRALHAALETARYALKKWARTASAFRVRWRSVSALSRWVPRRRTTFRALPTSFPTTPVPKRASCSITASNGNAIRTIPN